jgi:hypothetical protein
MSTPINDGGPAFPVQSIYSEDHGTNSRGMTLRDYFAGQALANVDVRIPMSDDDDTPSPRAIANYMYAMADAMLAAREAKL